MARLLRSNGINMPDLKLALRQLWKNPGFTAAAILTLGIGIGANTAIFSILNAAFLKPLPFKDPQQLVALYTSDYSGPVFGASSRLDLIFLRENTPSLSDLIMYWMQPMSLRVGDETRQVFGELASGNLFPFLGVKPALGRGFLSEEDLAPGTHPVAVLSRALWQREFNSDPEVIGKQISLNTLSFTVVGVAPENFHGLTRGLRADLWTPLMMQDALTPGRLQINERGARSYMALARLRSGATLAEAQAELNVAAGQLHKSFPEHWTNVRQEPRTITALAENDARIAPEVRGPVKAFVMLLMGVAALVLLTACTNVASLVLARGTARAREMAIRRAVGASRTHLIRQLLAEHLLLAGLGGCLGIAVANGLLDLLAAIRPPAPVPLFFEFPMDLRVLGFTLAVSVLAGLFFGLIPAWKASRADLSDGLKADGRGARVPARWPLQRFFVAGQVAVSLLLLVVSGLFLRSLANAATADLGFTLREGFSVSTDLSLQGYDQTRGSQFYAELLRRVQTLPGVQSATLAQTIPLGLGGNRRRLWVEGHQPRPGEDMEVHSNIVGPRFFQTLGTPIVRGRDFTEADRAGAPGVVIVNETMARRFWPGADPIGKRVSVTGEDGAWLEVAGLVKDGKYVARGENPLPYFAAPVQQSYAGDLTLLVRGDVATLAPAVRSVFRDLDAYLPLAITTLREHLDVSLIPSRILAGLLGGFGAAALLLAVVGVYGMIAFVTSQRTRELGIRAALGATRSGLTRLILAQGARLILTGMLVGSLLALGATQLLGSFLFGVGPLDLLSYVAAWLTLGGIALLASYIPARRAARVDPMEALRCE